MESALAGVSVAGVVVGAAGVAMAGVGAVPPTFAAAAAAENGSVAGVMGVLEAAGAIDTVTWFGLIPNSWSVADNAADRALWKPSVDWLEVWGAAVLVGSCGPKSDEVLSKVLFS